MSISNSPRSVSGSHDFDIRAVYTNATIVRPGVILINGEEYDVVLIESDGQERRLSEDALEKITDCANRVIRQTDLGLKEKNAPDIITLGYELQLGSVVFTTASIKMGGETTRVRLSKPAESITTLMHQVLNRNKNLEHPSSSPVLGRRRKSILSLPNEEKENKENSDHDNKSNNLSSSPANNQSPTSSLD